ncbi:MAG: sugar ABC transporter permease [Clostridia bacterium]|nr:sugar ABC transporter permease [Clostridia bacterium]
MPDITAVKENQPKVEKSRKEMTKFQWTLHEMKRTWVGYVMVAPFFVRFVLFTVLPVVLSILLCFTSFNMLQWPKFIFMDNFVRMFTADDLFMTAFKNTIMFAIATGPTSYILSFVIAWFINEIPPKTRSFVTFIFYSPSMAGGVTGIWSMIFASDIYGYANGWLMSLGLIREPILFFQDVNYIFPLVVICALWGSLGTSFLAFIAGLQGVDRHLYEAAAVDGIKNRWQEAWYITLPSMKPMLMFGALLSITSGFGFGGLITALCGTPSTDYVAWTLTHHIAEYMGTRMEYGYSSALSVILFLLMVGSNTLVQKFLAKVGQ